ncbi:MAG TPA: leucyl aminopeptidase [Candidatus Methylomirabilis sp.]|jgi:leucyl aminopeptidase|nr:leucyl aminopeptidase [Candidatus Methylomirabilis sp.]
MAAQRPAEPARTAVRVEDVTAYRGDALVVNLFEGVSEPTGATGAVDTALGGAIRTLIRQKEITGKAGELTAVHPFDRLPVARVLVVGLGKQEQLDLERVRALTGEALRLLRRTGARRVGTILHGAGGGGLDPPAAAQAVIEGAILGCYRFDRYKKAEKDRKVLEELTILTREGAGRRALEEALRRGRIVAEAVTLARDLVNAPPNDLTPAALAAAASAAARSAGFSCRVLERGQMRRLGMGALLGVAQGSANPPRLIVLRHRGSRQAKPAVAFVGKGVTFDTGGISIKPAENMESMKGDMSGAAAVIGAFAALARLRAKVHVLGVIPAVENMPSGTATRPGDILRAMSGKTIEVINTDAEGRLILADALTYARREGAARLVDIATLTGACVVALGTIRSGAFANDEAWLAAVREASDAAGEKVWPLPMDEEYDELIKSDVAEIKNTGGRKGGAITAAKFLAHFVDQTPWVHLDIAGTFETDKEKGYRVKGGTGVAVRTLVELGLRLAG